MDELRSYAQGLHVLLVEDNETVLKQTYMLLEMFFNDVETASNGLEGLKKYADFHDRTGSYPDLIITDIGMPECNGIEMSKQILERNPEQEIIVISAYNDSEYLYELINLGISHFINKPIDTEQFGKILFATCKAISDRHQLKAYYKTIEKLNNELTDKNNRLVEALTILDEHIIYSETDLSGMITDASSAFAKISGYTKEELVGKPHNVVRHPDMPSSVFEELWETIKRREVWQGEIKNRTKNGGYYYVFSSIKPKYDRSGEHVGYISIRQDVSQQKENAVQKEQLMHQSRHAIMGEMISIIAHQWKQPLNHLSLELYNLYKQVKKEPVDKEAARFHYDNGEKILVNLSDIISTFKGFFKPSAAREKIALSDAIESALLLLEPLTQKHGVTVRIDCQAAKPHIIGAQNELSQVFINILKNSIDELEKREVEAPYIAVEVRQSSEKIVVRICDNGGGVSPENMAKLFEPYFTTKSNEGTGMGLYMVKLIMEEKLSGTISVENAEEGLCTILEFPLVV